MPQMEQLSDSVYRFDAKGQRWFDARNPKFNSSELWYTNNEFESLIFK